MLAIIKSKNKTYYAADGNKITSLWIVNSDGNPIPFEFTNASKNGYKNVFEYIAVYKK